MPDEIVKSYKETNCRLLLLCGNFLSNLRESSQVKWPACQKNHQMTQRRWARALRWLGRNRSLN